MPIVWEMPDGSVQVTQIVDSVLERERRPGETTAAVVLRLAATIQAKTPGLATGIPSLVKHADLPTTRERRHAWRLRNGAVIADLAVPDPPRKLTVEERLAALEARP